METKKPKKLPEEMPIRQVIAKFSSYLFSILYYNHRRNLRLSFIVYGEVCSTFHRQYRVTQTTLVVIEFNDTDSSTNSTISAF